MVRISKGLLSLICLMAMILYFGLNVTAATITVSTGTELQNALVSATAGTIILVNPGTYTISSTSETVSNGIGGTMTKTWFFGGSQTNGTSSNKIIAKSANASNQAILDGEFPQVPLSYPES